jgi:hypothetical protein
LKASMRWRVVHMKREAVQNGPVIQQVVKVE